MSPCSKGGYSKTTCAEGDRSLTCRWASGPSRSYCRKAGKKQNTSPCARRGYSKTTCAEGGRSLTCRWASGPSRSYCRRAGKKPGKKSKKKKEPFSPSTPVTKHYMAASLLNSQPSILSFRRRCRLFPHPVEIYSKTGIQIPLNKNYAAMWKGNNRYTTLVTDITSFIPPLQTWQHIFPIVNRIFFPINEYREGDVIIGVKYVTHPTGGAHLVFFEVRMEREGPSAIVIDPNGYSFTYKDHLDKFFGPVPYTITAPLKINVAEKSVRQRLEQLGFENDAGDLQGYCATIASYYLIDYVCTNQWVKRDISHFVRASEEWAYSFMEQHFGIFSPTTLTLRIILFGRYLGYHLCRLFLNVPEENTLQTVSVNVRYSAPRELTTTIRKGDSSITMIDSRPLPIKKDRIGTRLKF